MTVYRIEVSSAGDPAEQSPVVNITEPSSGYTAVPGVAFNLAAVANDYEDGDLSANIAWKSDRNGYLHTGAGFTANTADRPLNIGTHVITASVSDSVGNTGESTISIIITDPNAATESYISGLTGEASTSGRKWSVNITATVLDNKGNAVADATVTGNWSGAAKDSDSCLTGTTGQCSIIKDNLQSRNTSITFTVTDITHATLIYASERNSVDNTITLNAP